MNVGRGDRVTALGHDGEFETVSIRPEGVAVIRNLAPGYEYTSSVPVKQLTLAGPRGACRWMLDCTAPAVEAITVDSLGTDVDTCAEHGADWHHWHDSTALNRGPAPEPECYCPDTGIEIGEAVAYCPLHGTPEERGLDPFAD